jgi:adenylate kinase family enzyme
MYEHPEAILLLGPTGSGKTPLGQMLSERGVAGQSCVHFDFGENLRQVVAGGQPDEVVSREDIEFLRVVLQRGALLEDEDFPIAERVLRRFLSKQGADAETLIVLNGLPRHIGQASAMAALLHVGTIVHLQCSAEAVLARIAGNTGGDRAGRSDDRLADVWRKFDIFARRTAPLVGFYASNGARNIQLEVTAGMTAEQMWQALDKRLRS